MSIIERRTLEALAAAGPASNKAIADVLGWPPADVYRIVYRLRQRGLATAAPAEGYDITDAGRRVLAGLWGQRRMRFA